MNNGAPVGPKTAPPPPGPTGAKSAQSEIVLVSNVTAPVRAQAAPQLIEAPVFSVMLACARMSPPNDVVVPSVAELPARQNTFPPCAPLISTTFDALAVVSELPILKMNTAFGLPKP